MNKTADSSVTIAALWGDHPAHETATAALATCRTTIAHVAVETYSVLTRLPPPHHADATTTAAALEGRMPKTYATLDASTYSEAPTRLAGADVSGGATYDGLIALIALEHDLEIVTRDRRAERTYRALDVPYQLLG